MTGKGWVDLVKVLVISL